MPIIATSFDAPPAVIDVTPASTVSVQPRDKAELQRDARTWSEKVAALTISTAQDCVNASLLLRSIKGVRTDITNWFAPHINAAMETKRRAEAARKALADESDRMQAPLIAAEMDVKGKLLAYEREQERARQAEEARLQDEARKRAEEETLAAAAALELEATRTGDAEMQAEADSILAQPVDVPAVLVKSSVPKVQGIVYRDNWTVHPSVDVKALAAAVAKGEAPANLLQPNMVALRAWAKATQGGQALPGVRVVNDRQIAARG
jgi:hypothetical protein